MVKWLAGVAALALAACALSFPDYPAQDTGSSGSCSESPCKLTAPQCGCGEGQKCALAGASRTCVPDGTLGLGADCSSNVSGCVAGLFCAQTTATISTCWKFCDTDADCEAPGGACIQIPGGGPDTKVCSANCDPVTGAGCPVAGTACLFSPDATGTHVVTTCGGAGTRGVGEVCSAPDDCAPTLMCAQINSSNVCLQVCNVNAPACPSPLSCVPLSPPNTLGATVLGACAQ